MKFTLKSNHKNLITQNAANYSEVNKTFFDLALIETNQKNMPTEFNVLMNDSVKIESYTIYPFKKPTHRTTDQ